MPATKATPDRLAAFSDGVIAIIITIMVLELKAPRDSSLAALFELWPVFASYALSYLFVGIVWVNHHHLLRHAEDASPLVIWTNLAFLFFVSLIPFSTAYMAENHMNSFTTAVYACLFLLITIAFMIFQNAIAIQFGNNTDLKNMDHAATRRNWIALALYALAIAAAWLHPAVSLGIILCNAVLYFIPDARKQAKRR